jgi:hypothetical protein
MRTRGVFALGALALMAACGSDTAEPAPTTTSATAAVATTGAPTTPAPTTVEPTTIEPTAVEPTTVAPTTIAPATSAVAEPDSPDTLSAPEAVATSDGRTHFVYGAPAGQNHRDVKRIVISLPGHGTSAEDGYAAWSRHIVGGNWAVAELDWWDGEGEDPTDYEQPAEIVPQVRAFLHEQGYDADDVVVLHGFSRGSANTYGVIANDRLQPGAVFDAVISNAGKYQAGFPITDHPLSDDELTQLFSGVPWVLVCGGQDPNPDRDGCPGMTETQTFLDEHGADVLALLTDPDEGHGAFHLSPLGLPAQAFALIDAALGVAT